MKLMLNDKPIARFAAIFLLAYFVLYGLTQVGPISSGLSSMYRGLCKTTAEMTMGGLDFVTKAFSENGRLDNNKMVVDFKWSQSTLDKAIEEARRAGVSDLEVPYRFISYLLFEFFTVPLLFLLSLIIATPMGWKKKIKFGSFALISMLVLLLLKFYLMTLFSVAKAEIGVYELDHAAKSTLQWLAGLWTLGFSIVLAFFCWLGWVFRNSELKDNFSSLIHRLEG